MENRRDEETNMESDECTNSIVSSSSGLTSVASSDSERNVDSISKVYKDATSYDYFHEMLMRNIMIKKPTDDNRIQMIQNAKAQLLEELDRINAMENRVKDLVNHYDDYKKS